LLESPKPIPVLKDDPEVHPNSEINRKPQQKKIVPKISKKKDSVQISKKEVLLLYVSIIYYKNKQWLRTLKRDYCIYSYSLLSSAWYIICLNEKSFLEEQAWKTFWKLYPYNRKDRTCKQLQACPVLATLEKKKRQ